MSFMTPEMRSLIRNAATVKAVGQFGLSMGSFARGNEFERFVGMIAVLAQCRCAEDQILGVLRGLPGASEVEELAAEVAVELSKAVGSMMKKGGG